MAEATAKTETVIKSVTLTLSAEEAQVIIDVFNHVGGDYHSTPRGACDRITNALVAEGFQPRREAFHTDQRPVFPGGVTPLMWKDNMEVF